MRYVTEIGGGLERTLIEFDKLLEKSNFKKLSSIPLNLNFYLIEGVKK